MLPQRKEPDNETEATRHVTWNCFAADRTAGVCTSCIFRRVRYQQAADAEGNAGEVGDGQSPLLVPYQRYWFRWKSDRMDDRGRQPERTYPHGCHKEHFE